MKYALISTSNKTNLIEFANALHSLNYVLIATGGTAELLRQSKIPIQEVSEYTGFPEIMDGRVKTLHPKIHGGLLARRGIDDEILKQHNINPIDLLIVNLYPFTQTIANPNCTLDNAIEQIDIGGPTMLRAAAKNYGNVTAIVDPNDYTEILEEIKQNGTTTLTTRKRLAIKIFQHTAAYDKAIVNYLSNQSDYELNAHKVSELRYGENPHQRAAFYINSSDTEGTLAAAKQLQGKPLSFNNMQDSDAALNCVRALDSKNSSCVIVKHATPCGVAQAATLIEAYNKALATDPTSAFGGIIAFNKPLDGFTAKTILEQQFVEVILAPSIDNEAEMLLSSKPNLRVLSCGYPKRHIEKTLHSISGGLLIQDADSSETTSLNLNIVSKRQPTQTEMDDLIFAWQVVRFVKSNAIVYAKNLMTLGIGGEQTSRVFSAQIAVLKAAEAKLTLENAVMASDAFFPFADGLQVGIEAGICAVIQPGGSKRDDEVIAAANAANIVMVFTGTRHFRH